MRKVWLRFSCPSLCYDYVIITDYYLLLITNKFQPLKIPGQETRVSDPLMLTIRAVKTLHTCTLPFTHS